MNDRFSVLMGGCMERSSTNVDIVDLTPMINTSPCLESTIHRNQHNSQWVAIMQQIAPSHFSKDTECSAPSWLRCVVLARARRAMEIHRPPLAKMTLLLCFLFDEKRLGVCTFNRPYNRPCSCCAISSTLTINVMTGGVRFTLI